MELKIINEEEYRNFVYSNKNFNYLQSIEMGIMKSYRGYSYELLGIYKNNKIVGAALALKKKTFLNYYSYYIPGGYTIDYNDLDLISEITKLIKEYAKKNNIYKITVDPPIIYQIRNNDGSVNSSYIPNDKLINHLKSLEYKHFGFNLNFETNQVRFVYRKKLLPTYEETFSSFSKSTQKNILNFVRNGIKVKKCTEEDIDDFSEILKSTAERKSFHFWNTNHYKKMYNIMGNFITMYITYFDVNEYIRNNKEFLKEEEEVLKVINDKMIKEKVGKKLKSDYEICNKNISNYKSKIEYGLNLLKEGKANINIGALLSVKSGNENITLLSGTIKEYVFLGPKYAFYNEHIKDSIEEGFEYVNFYGISGDFDKKNKYYGIFEIKQGFNGEVVEYIGEFTLVTKKLINTIIKIGKKLLNKV